MKSFILTIFFTVVCFSVVSWGDPPFNCDSTNDKRPKGTELFIPYDNRCIPSSLLSDYTAKDLGTSNITACNDANKEFQKELKNLNAICANNNGSSSDDDETDNKCVQIAKSCANLNTQSQSQDTLLSAGLSYFAMNKQDYNSNCQGKNMTLAEAQKSKEDMEKKKTELDTKFKDLTDSLGKDKQTVADADKNLKQDTSKLDDEYSKQKVSDQKAGEAEVAGLTDQIHQAQMNMRTTAESQSKLLMEKMAVQQNHLAQMMKLSDSTLQADCAQKVRTIMDAPANSNSTIITGGVSAGMSAAGSSGTTAAKAWSDCVTSYNNARQSEIDNYNAALADIDTRDQNFRATYTEQQNSIASLNQQIATANSRNQSASTQGYSIYLQKRLALQSDYTNTLKNSQDKINQEQLESIKLSNEIAANDNALNTLAKNMPNGDKRVTDAVGAATNLITSKSDLLSACGCAEDSGDKDYSPGSASAPAVQRICKNAVTQSQTTLGKYGSPDSSDDGSSPSSTHKKRKSSGSDGSK